MVQQNGPKNRFVRSLQPCCRQDSISLQIGISQNPASPSTQTSSSSMQHRHLPRSCHFLNASVTTCILARSLSLPLSQHNDPEQQSLTTLIRRSPEAWPRSKKGL